MIIYLLLIGAVLWVICGLFNYKATVAYFSHAYSDLPWGWGDTVFSLIYGFAGLLSLPATILGSRRFRYGFHRYENGLSICARCRKGKRE